MTRRSLADLGAPPAVGAPKGFAVRAIVADPLFATHAGTGPKVLVTNDEKIYASLAQRMDPNLRPGGEGWAKVVLKKYPNGFDFTLNGQTIRILPVPN